MQAKHAKLRNHAFATAEKRIRESGLDGLNARFIAKSIGCSVGTLYNLFKSIDFIIFGVNLRTLSTLEAQMIEAAASKTQGCEALKAIAKVYIQFSVNNPQLWLALFEHSFPDPNDTPSDYYEKRTSLFKIIEQQLGLIFPDMPKSQLAIEARTLWASIHGICTLNLHNKLDDGMDIQQLSSSLIKKFTADNQGASS